MTDETCQYPQRKPATAYGKGCRCLRCFNWQAERCRDYYAENRERETARARVWREENRDYSRAISARNRARYAERSLATVAGRYSLAEDAEILGWEYGWLSLAIKLGRTHASIHGRVARLRKMGDRMAWEQAGQ